MLAPPSVTPGASTSATSNPLSLKSSELSVFELFFFHSIPTLLYPSAAVFFWQAAMAQEENGANSTFFPENKMGHAD